jgi:hypothetical protein
MIEQGTPEFIKNSEGRILQWKNCNCGNGGRYVRKSQFEKFLARCDSCVKNVIGIKNTKHGMKYSSEYHIWNGIKNRCLNSKSKDYSRYGAKGITMCKEWANSFEQFYKDMGNRPEGLSIERIDNKKGYSPENCKWADRSTQQRNKSNSLWVEWKGEIKHIMEVAQELGISNGAAHLRYKRGTLYV